MASRKGETEEDVAGLDEMAKLGLLGIQCGNSRESVPEERLCLQLMTGHLTAD